MLLKLAVVYRLVYLPLAREDMVDFAGYISRTLGNPQAAMVLAEELVKAVDSLTKSPMHTPSISLYAHCSMSTENYMSATTLFYAGSTKKPGQLQ
jgi:hypothetical protein